jgi:Prokaryotic cytochrome b561
LTQVKATKPPAVHRSRDWKSKVTRNSSTQWGWPAKLLHWIGAVMILLLLVHGWWMTHLKPRPERLANYAGHSALGYDLLAILILRLLWRWFNPVPELPAELEPWERKRKRSEGAQSYGDVASRATGALFSCDMAASM